MKKTLIVSCTMLLTVILIVGCSLTTPPEPDPTPTPIPGPTATPDNSGDIVIEPTVTPEPEKVTLAKNIVLYLGSTFNNVIDDLIETNIDRIDDATITVTLLGLNNSTATLELSKNVVENEIYLDQIYTFNDYTSLTMTLGGKITISSKLTLNQELLTFDAIYNDSVVTANSVTVNGTEKTITTLDDLYNEAFLNDLTSNIAVEGPAYIKLLANFMNGIPGTAEAEIVVSSAVGGTVTIALDIGGSEESVGITNSRISFTFTDYVNDFSAGGTSGQIELDGTVHGTPDFVITGMEDFLNYLLGQELTDDTVSLDTAISFSGDLSLSIDEVNVSEVSLEEFNLYSLRFLRSFDTNEITYYSMQFESVLTDMYYHGLQIPNIPFVGSLLSNIAGTIRINGVRYTRDMFENYIYLDGIFYDAWAEENPGYSKSSDLFKEVKLFYKFRDLTLYNSFKDKLDVAIFADNGAASSYTIKGNKCGTAVLDKTTHSVTFDSYSDNDARITGTYYYQISPWDEDNYFVIEATSNAGILVNGNVAGIIQYNFEQEYQASIPADFYENSVLPLITDETDKATLNGFYKDMGSTYQAVKKLATADSERILAILQEADATNDSYTLSVPGSFYDYEVDFSGLITADEAFITTHYTLSGNQYTYQGTIDNTSDTDRALTLLAGAGLNLAPTSGMFELSISSLYQIYNSVGALDDRTFFKSLYEISGSVQTYGDGTEYYNYVLKTPELSDADIDTITDLLDAYNFYYYGESTKRVTLE